VDNSPCLHLGPVAERRRIRTALSAKIVQVHQCGVFGACTQHDPAQGLACCAPEGGTPCPRYQNGAFRRIAPLGTAELARRHEGRAARKPWEYRVTVAIPHLDTLELLRTVIDLHRLQSERPYVLILDTGSPPAVCEELETLRAEDLEIHYIRSNAYRHSSEPVVVAMDLAFALCHTRYLYCTHADVFPMRRDLVAFLADQCDADRPAVGWEMSPRTGFDLWKGVLSHTSTILHMPTMHLIGASWSMQRWWTLHPEWNVGRNGWPDTETGLDECFREWQVKKTILGGETNFERQTTEWWDHARSITGLRVHAPHSELRQKAEAYAGAALADARARALAWKSQV
jgi:hypothetical protein